MESLLPLSFQRGMDRTLKMLRLLRPSSHFNNFAASVSASYPCLTDLDTRLRITESSSLLPYPSSVLGHTLVSQTYLVVEALTDSPTTRSFARIFEIRTSTRLYTRSQNEGPVSIAWLLTA